MLQYKTVGIDAVHRALLCVILLFSLSGTAIAIEPVRMGYVDMPRILEASGVAKESETEARQAVAAARAKLEAEQQAIIKEQQEYKRDEAIMSESQRSEKQQALQVRMQAYQQMATDMQNDITRQKMQLVEKIMGPVQKIIAEVAREEGLNAIFERTESALLFVDDSMDLTDRVIERMKKAD